MKLATAILVALLSMTGAAQAQTIYKSYQFTYKNKGGYSADVYIKVKNDDGSTTKFKPRCVTVATLGGAYLTNTATAGIILECDVYINTKHLGKEYWPYIQIAAGENKSCRKDGFRLIVTKVNTKDTFVNPNYRTAGTTFNNNRCKVGGIP